MPQLLRPSHSPKRFIPIFGALIIAQAVSGCVMNSKSQGDSDFVTGSIGSNDSLLQESNKWAAKWQKNPTDTGIAINYARSLSASGSHKKAVQVLQQASLTSPKNQAVIAEYGKALSTTGQLKQAMHNLNRAQSLGNPDWRIYSAQGITLDRLKQHVQARQHYKTALNLRPNHPTVLNNIGLSYALEGDLKNAETFLRRAVASNNSTPKTKKNLALILGLNGKFSQSAQASNEVLSSEDTTVNIAYLKNMLSQPGTWQKLSGKTKVAKSVPRKTKKRLASKPRKITTLETKKVTKLDQKKLTSQKAAKLKVSAKKPLVTKSGKSDRAATKSNADTGKKLSLFNSKIKKAIAATQKTASVEQLNLRAN